MLLFEALHRFFSWLFEAFLKIADIAEEIWFIGGRIAPWFLDVARQMENISDSMASLSDWADNLEDRIRSALTWDKIKVNIEDRFPIVTWSAGDFVDWIWDRTVAKAETWLEDHLDWVWKTGERILNKLW